MQASAEGTDPGLPPPGLEGLATRWPHLPGVHPTSFLLTGTLPSPGQGPCEMTYVVTTQETNSLRPL